MNETIDRNNPNQLCIPILIDQGAAKLYKLDEKEKQIILTVMLREIIAHLGKHGENIDLEKEQYVEFLCQKA